MRWFRPRKDKVLQAEGASHTWDLTAGLPLVDGRGAKPHAVEADVRAGTSPGQPVSLSSFSAHPV